jgi:hypothetical protein
MAKAPMNPLAGPGGPGPFSTRKDLLTMPSAEYGEGVETAAIKAGAPLAKTADVRGARASDVREAATRSPITLLFAPSQRPDEPITSGIAMGAGPGPEVLGMQPVQEKLSDVLARMLPYDQSGEVEILYQRALARGM